MQCVPFIKLCVYLAMRYKASVLSRKMTFLVSGVFLSNIVNHWRALDWVVCCRLSTQLNVVQPSTSLSVILSSYFVSMSTTVHHTHSWRLSYTNTTRVNYFLFICTWFEVAQSRVIAILNKLPSLTALMNNFNAITCSEKEVRMCNSTLDIMCVFVIVCVALMLIFVYVLTPEITEQCCTCSCHRDCWQYRNVKYCILAMWSN